MYIKYNYQIDIKFNIVFDFIIRPMVFGLKNGLTFESIYILSTMTESAISGDVDSVPLKLNINAIETTQSSDEQHKNQLVNISRTPVLSSNLRTPMRVQVEYPDSISRKRRHLIASCSGESPKKKVNFDSSMLIEQFREECPEDDVLLSQVADFHVNDEPDNLCTEDNSNLSIGLSDTGRVFARCYTLPIEKSPKKGKVIVYDSDGLGGDSD